MFKIFIFINKIKLKKYCNLLINDLIFIVNSLIIYKNDLINFFLY
jgi:hypothetical protein